MTTTANKPAQSSDNLALWSRLSITDPAHAKPFSRTGGFKGTAIKPMWAIRRMTEEFGSVGHGWGWAEHQHVIENGMMFAQVSVWYVPPGQEPGMTTSYANGIIAPANARFGGPQWGGTEIVMSRGDRKMADDESFKKSTTDAILKCLSYIGIGADIHMGFFDDSKYVEQATTHHSQDAGSEDVDMKTVKGFLIQLGDCGSMDALKAKHDTFKDSLAKIKPRSPGAYKHYADEMAKHKARFEPQKEAAE